MTELAPCATCDRHVRLPDACPFCGASSGDARPGAVRPVTRREWTRAAIFAGAALLVGCGGSDDEPTDDDGSDTSGGEAPIATRVDAGHDAGAPDAGRPDAGAPDAGGLDAGPSPDAGPPPVIATADGGPGPDAGAPQRVIPPDHGNPRRRRRLPACVTEGTCPAPPYGAPPSEIIV